MLCQKCGKKEAVVHVVCMVNNKQIDKWLCADCAEKLMPYAVSGGGRAVDPRNLLETLFLAVSRQTAGTTFYQTYGFHFGKCHAQCAGPRA